jgi:hypothetical protein
MNAEIEALRDRLNNAAKEIQPYTSAKTLEELSSLRQRQEFLFGAALALTGLVSAEKCEYGEAITWSDLAKYVKYSVDYILEERK